jgi:hypothetical protein
VRLIVMLAAIAAAFAAYTSVGASPVRAAPHGGRAVSGIWWSYLEYFGIGTVSNGVWSSGLTSLGCPFVPHDGGDGPTGEAATSNLTATYTGWVGPINFQRNTEKVFLQTILTGTLEDAAGNTYTVSGTFTDRSIRNDPTGSDLRFDGVGQVSLSGPAGSVVGSAELRYVTGPPDLLLTFSRVTSCTVS